MLGRGAQVLVVGSIGEESATKDQASQQQTDWILCEWLLAVCGRAETAKQAEAWKRCSVFW